MHSVARLDVVIASGIGLETVIARSEATKQSIVTVVLAVDCFASLAMTVGVASLLAMTANTASRSRRRLRARFARNVPPSEDQRAQGMPGARRARSLACE